MRKAVLQQIDKLVIIIYSIDKAGLDKAFIDLIDMLMKLIEEESFADCIELNQILLELQNAYVKKDLVDLADVLQYSLKTFLE